MPCSFFLEVSSVDMALMLTWSSSNTSRFDLVFSECLPLWLSLLRVLFVFDCLSNPLWVHALICPSFDRKPFECMFESTWSLSLRVSLGLDSKAFDCVTRKGWKFSTNNLQYEWYCGGGCFYLRRSYRASIYHLLLAFYLSKIDDAKEDKKEEL